MSNQWSVRWSVFALSLIAAWGTAAGQSQAAWANAGLLELKPVRRTGSLSLDVYRYFLGAESYTLPIVSAELGKLHLEGRYQYEALSTTSTWAGRVFELASARIELVPMAGVLFGRMDGFGAGLEATVSLRHFELYDEAELVLDAHGREGNFLYSWFTASWHATSWLDVGLSAQRTRTHESGLDVDRGLFVAITRRRVTFSTYAFNLTGSPFAIVALGLELPNPDAR